MRLYSPTLVLYFLKMYQDECRYPREMLDANLATDEAKLEYTARLFGGEQMLLDITREDKPTAVSRISIRFGMRDMRNDRSKDYSFIAS